jgi:hypothetical protein
LSATGDRAGLREPIAASAAASRGHILVVEDDDQLRSYTDPDASSPKPWTLG